MIDRSPPFLLQQLAKLIIMRQRHSSGLANKFRTPEDAEAPIGKNAMTRKKQLQILSEVNEVVLALDLAQRVSVRGGYQS